MYHRLLNVADLEDNSRKLAVLKLKNSTRQEDLLNLWKQNAFVFQR